MLENLIGKEFYNAYFHYIVGVCILIFGIIVANVIVVTLRNLLTYDGANSEEKAKILKLVSRIHLPINLVFIAISTYAVHKLGDFPAKFEPYLLLGVKTILDSAFFMTVYHFVGALVLTRLFSGFGLTINDTIKDLLANAVKIVIAVLGVVTVLGNFNINIGPVLGGLTLLTSAVALAAKDSIQGLIGSLTVVLEGKFKQGDWIKMADVQGFVENIGIRTTSIRGFDRTLTTIPNDVFVAASVTNYSRITNWEVREDFVLAHKSTQEQLEKIVANFLDWLVKNPDIETDPKKAITVVRISNLTHHGFNLLLMFYVKTNEWPEHVRVREQCMFQLLKIVEDAGTTFAHPSQTVFLGESASLDKVMQVAGKTAVRKPDSETTVDVKKPSAPKEKK